MTPIGKMICLALILLLPSIAAAAPRTGGRAPDFNATTISGQQVSLSSLAGSVVILDFFATWCAPCRSSTDHLVGLHQKYRENGLRIVGMSIDPPSDRILRQHIAEKKIPYPVITTSEDVENDYAVRSLPLLCVIGKDGRVAAMFSGFNSEIAAAVDRLVGSLLKIH